MAGILSTGSKGSGVVSAAGWKAIVNVVEICQRKSDLLEVIGAGTAAGGLTSLLHSRQKESNKNADDGNDDEEFNQSKASVRLP